MKKFDYRLSGKVCDNRDRSEHEVSQEEKWKIIGIWHQQSECFGRRIIKKGHCLLNLPKNSDDGCVEYLHKLECKLEGETEWRFVGFLDQNDFDALRFELVE